MSREQWWWKKNTINTNTSIKCTSVEKKVFFIICSFTHSFTIELGSPVHTTYIGYVCCCVQKILSYRCEITYIAFDQRFWY